MYMYYIESREILSRFSIMCETKMLKSHRLEKIIDTYLGNITLVIVIGLQMSHISWAK